jgi:hypothetical protein
VRPLNQFILQPPALALVEIVQFFGVLKNWPSSICRPNLPEPLSGL